ncbi:MAG: diguanylate cyclase [Actinomycetota bacterium]|nr:diguanylate cyclase [Actinomycetota bacterium]
MPARPGDRPAGERRRPDRVPGATVLVVDDSGAIRRILRRSLESVGYRVQEAPDGEQALAACRAERPDLVLLDVDMPGLDGLSTLRAMKADDELRSLPVLFLTARTDAAEVADGLDLGAADYLRKPCDAAELTARVNAALRDAAREQDLARRAAELDNLATTDALTGLGNRRRLEMRVVELAGTRGADAAVGVLLLDVDHFKRVNDEQGHLVGDLVLRILGGRLQSALESEAAVVRWGGEEFLALAPDASEDDLVPLAERVRRAVCGSPFSLGGGRLLDVTVSVGCGWGPLARFDAVVADADAALYEAKRAGRNRVATAPR